jgi:hypothetical protein
VRSRSRMRPKARCRRGCRNTVVCSGRWSP